MTSQTGPHKTSTFRNNYESQPDEDTLDQQYPSIIDMKQKRFLKDNTPLLKKAQKQMEQLDDFLIPLMLRNSEAATTAASEESVIVPFVESKRPEVIIKKQ